MNEFALYGLGFLTVFRLIAMFGRERVPVDEPVKVDGERVISDDSARDPTRITRRHFVIALRALGGVAASAVLWRIYHQNHQVVPDGIYRMAGWAASCVVTALLFTMLATLGGTARSQRVLLDILLAGVPAAWLAAFGGPLARWPDARGLPVVRLDRDEYQLMRSRNCVEVLWHTGHFGDGWIEGYQPYDPVGCDEGVEK